MHLKFLALHLLLSAPNQVYIFFFNKNILNAALIKRENLFLNDSSSDPDLPPAYLEIRASSVNIKIHGVYKLQPELTLHHETYSWYPKSERLRPVYKRLTKIPCYVYWTPHNNWLITTTHPEVYDPKTFAEILGILPSIAHVPVYLKGWYIRKSNKAEDTQKGFELAKENESIVPEPDPSFAHVLPKEFVWDPFVISAEAFHNTVSTSDTEFRDGCPDSNGFGLSGLSQYMVDPCSTPTFSEANYFGQSLEITFTGADGYLKNALFSWGGYYLRRPFFESRSPRISSPKHGSVSCDFRIKVLWADGPLYAAPTWYISEQLGNKHLSQVFARWNENTDTAIKKRLPLLEWPAQLNSELHPGLWKLSKNVITYSHMKELTPFAPKEGIKTSIFIQIPIPTGKFFFLRGLHYEVNGKYEHMGNYLGYPYFRQQKRDQQGLGYALYRGYMLKADCDHWVIGASLGSIEGIIAYKEESNNLWPHINSNPWYVWSSKLFRWKPVLGAKIEFGVEQSENRLFEVHQSLALLIQNLQHNQAPKFAFRHIFSDDTKIENTSSDKKKSEQTELGITSTKDSEKKAKELQAHSNNSKEMPVLVHKVKRHR